MKYSIQGVKLIVLNDYLKGCGCVHLALRVLPEAQGLMSMATVECYFNHRIKRSQSEHLRTNFRSSKERKARLNAIATFLEENKHTAKDIIAERIAQSRDNFVALNIRLLSANATRTASSSRRTSPTSSSRNEPQFERSRIILFEREKHSYISHISKMDGQFPELLRASRKKFEVDQFRRIRSMVTFVELNAFLRHIAHQSFLFCGKLYRKKRIEVHCRVFLRRLKNRVRKKMLFATKVKLSIKLAGLLSAKLVLDQSEAKARGIVTGIFDAMLMKQLKDNLLSCSSVYLQHVIRLQKFIRVRSQART